MASWLSSCERPPGEPYFKEELDGAEASPAMMSELDELVKQRCDRLGRYLDARLAFYHGDLLQRLGEATTCASAASEDVNMCRLEAKADSLRPAPIYDVPALKTQVSYDCESHTGADPSDLQFVSTTPSASMSKEDNDTSKTFKHSNEVLQEAFRCLSFDETDNVRRTRSKQASCKTRAECDEFNGGRGRRRRGKGSRLRSWTEELRRLIESTAFETFICVLIVSNVVLLGVEVEMIGDQGSVPEVFKVVEFAYTLCFAQELIMRLAAYGPWTFLCTEGRIWNLIDLILVMVSLTEYALKVVFPGSSFAYARAVRILRAAHVFRVVRIMKFFRPLRILVYSVANTMRSLLWTLVLLAIIIYSFAIMFTMASSRAMIHLDSQQVESAVELAGREQLETYFGSLWTSITTLFLSITGGMDWEKNTSALAVISPVWAVVFMAYIAFSHLAFVNVVTGVVCQGAIESAQQDQDNQLHSQLTLKQKYIKQLEDLFKDIDADRSGNITLQEFEDRLYDDRLQEYFAAMDLTTDEAWNLFKLLDSSESCLIDVEEFVSGCLRLRGTARSVDVHMLMYQTKWTMKKLSTLMRSMEELRDEVQRPTLRKSARIGTNSLPFRMTSDYISECAGSAPV